MAKKTPDAPPPPTAAETQSAYAQQLTEVPEFSSYGPVLNSTATPAQLTESETEYQVTCVKHIFKEHIAFQVRTNLLRRSQSSTDEMTVQRLEYFARHSLGTSFGYHAIPIRRAGTDRGLHYTNSLSNCINFAWDRLCFVYPCFP